MFSVADALTRQGGLLPGKGQCTASENDYIEVGDSLSVLSGPWKSHPPVWRSFWGLAFCENVGQFRPIFEFSVGLE